MHILVTRPIEQTAVTADALEELGHSCTIEPLLWVEQLKHKKRSENYSGVLLTSRNAISALEFQYSKSERKTLPVLTTGNVTADLARSAGFSKVEYIQGSALDLANAVPKWVKSNNLDQNAGLLYPCAEQVAHDIPALLETHDVSVPSMAGLSHGSPHRIFERDVRCPSKWQVGCCFAIFCANGQNFCQTY